MKHPKVLAGLLVAGLLLPAFAAAQTTPSSGGSDAQLIAVLEQLVAELQQELQQLIALHHSPSFPQYDQEHHTSTSTPFSITAPTCRLDLSTTFPAAIADPYGVESLSWESTGATTGTITPGIGVVGPNGTRIVSGLTQNTTWTGTFTGASGIATCNTSYTSPGGGNTNVSLTATPTSGPAPLTVSFSVTGTGSSSITFGDGSLPQSVSQTSCTNSIPPSCSSQITHTYTSPGFYIVDLKNSSGTTVGFETILVTAPSSQPSSSTSTTPGGSCVAGTTTYQNGATIWYIGRPGPGSIEILGQTFTQWNCSNGQWVSVTNGSPSPTPTSGGSCTFIGQTYPNGSSIQCTENPSGGACPLGVPVSSWSCRNGQWVLFGSTGIPNTNTTSCTDTQGRLVPNGQTGMAYCGGNLLAIECVRAQLCVNGQWQDPAGNPNTASCVTMTGSQVSDGQNSCGDLYCPNNAASQKYYCQIGGPAGGWTWSSTPCTGNECLSL